LMCHETETALQWTEHVEQFGFSNVWLTEVISPDFWLPSWSVKSVTLYSTGTTVSDVSYPKQQTVNMTRALSLTNTDEGHMYVCELSTVIGLVRDTFSSLLLISVKTLMSLLVAELFS